MTIYIGNLSFRSTEQEVKALFEQFGEVKSVKLITDRDTGRKKGYGFVEMDDEFAKAAIENLNEKEFGGRNIKVNEAKEKEPRSNNRHF